MILNILNKNSRSGSCFEDCLSQLGEGDALLLIEDGVLAALDIAYNQQWLQRCPENVTLYVLRDDLLARGLETAVSPRFQAIGYDGFVELVERYKLSQSWY